MKKQIFGMALIGLMSSVSAAPLVIDMANFAEWGTDGGASFNDMTGKHQAYFVPDADVFSGGNSAVLAPDGSLVGPCPKTDATCVANWNISKTQGSGISVASKLKITAFVPSSAMGWGWATSGWWLIPSVNPAMSAPDAFGKAGPFGLDKAGDLSFELSYTSGKPLTFQFKGKGIDENDANQGPPRYTYTGKGIKEKVTFKVAQVKRAGWSIPLMYDAAGVTGIGIIRMEAAGTQGAPFPSDAPVTTDFEFWGASLPTTYSKVEDIPLPQPGDVAIKSAAQVELTGAVEVLNSLGQVVKTGDAATVTTGLENGVYFVRQNDQVQTITVQ